MRETIARQAHESWGSGVIISKYMKAKIICNLMKDPTALINSLFLVISFVAP